MWRFSQKAGAVNDILRTAMYFAPKLYMSVIMHHKKKDTNLLVFGIRETADRTCRRVD